MFEVVLRRMPFLAVAGQIYRWFFERADQSDATGSKITGGPPCGCVSVHRARAASISFDRIAERYDETRAYPAGVAEKIVEAIGGFARSGEPLLDIGVGTGRLAAPLHARGYDVVGVDVSRKMLGRAREKGLENLLLADARALPFHDGAFGCSVSVHVTHLIRDWMAALAEIGRVTRDWYASVATERDGCEVDGVQKAYEEACASHGFAVKHPGLRERELGGLVKPSECVRVAECGESVPTLEVMERYRSRVYSDLWDVPDRIHDAAIEELERRFGSLERLRRSERISLIAWSASDIREYTLGAGAEGVRD